MIDIHHHLIYGVDDGSDDLETSVQMVEMAAADGITHIVCTPHAVARYPYQPEVNAEHLAALRERVGDKVKLGLGCDFHLSFENIDDALANPHKYTLNGLNYLLVEFPDAMISPKMTDVFHEMTVAGILPIITHPERNLTLQRKPERMNEWLEQGCLVQVTANSLTGRFGRRAQEMGIQLIEQGIVHFLATDAHDLESRPPILSKARNIIADKFGADTAERLCVTNPLAAFEGRPLPDAPMPHLEQQANSVAARPGFLSRLFGRG
jgi:protein-tyrosine phosphatase